MAADGVTSPKQVRSKETFARVKATVVLLLRERRNADFTLGEISAASGVSIGSIYARVAGKNDLMIEVQREQYEVMEQRLVAALDAVAASPDSPTEPAHGEPLVRDVERAVDAFYGSLREHAALVTAFMRLATSSPEISARGVQSFWTSRDAFMRALGRVLARRSLEASEEALDWCFEMAYSVAIRQLTIGANLDEFSPERPQAPEGAIRKLSEATAAYLEREARP